MNNTLSATNMQYLLLTALLTDQSFMSLDSALERDMLALVNDKEPSPYGTRDDVQALASTILRAMRKAGIEVNLPDEVEEFTIDKEQAVKALFRLRKAVTEFLRITWTSDGAQSKEIEHLVGHLQVVMRYSRHTLRGRRGRTYVGYTVSV